MDEVLAATGNMLAAGGAPSLDLVPRGDPLLWTDPLVRGDAFG